MARLPGARSGLAPNHRSKQRGLIYRILFHNAGFWFFFFFYPLLASALYFYIRGRPVRVGTRSSLTPALPLYQTEVSALIFEEERRNVILKSAGMAFLCFIVVVIQRNKSDDGLDAENLLVHRGRPASLSHPPGFPSRF
jgi:hypothetical protein